MCLVVSTQILYVRLQSVTLCESELDHDEKRQQAVPFGESGPFRAANRPKSRSCTNYLSEDAFTMSE